MAVAAYFRTLRDGHAISQSTLARLVADYLGRPVDQSTIWRIEKNRMPLSGEMLMALLEVLGGNYKDVALLHRDKKATADQGEAMARRWLSLPPAERMSIDALIATTRQDDLVEILNDLQKPERQDHRLFRAIRSLIDWWPHASE